MEKEREREREINGKRSNNNTWAIVMGHGNKRAAKKINTENVWCGFFRQSL